MQGRFVRSTESEAETAFDPIWIEALQGTYA